MSYLVTVRSLAWVSPIIWSLTVSLVMHVLMYILVVNCALNEQVEYRLNQFQSKLKKYESFEAVVEK